METLNKIQLIGRVIKTTNIIHKDGNRWIYAWLDTELQLNTKSIIKLRGYGSHADLLSKEYMIGATLYVEGRINYNYTNDTTEIHIKSLSIISYSKQKINAVKDAFNNFLN